jgi:hypothetical protein
VFTEKELRKNPALIKAFTGLPADLFWELIKKMEEQLAEYERQRHERVDRERAIGGGRHYDQSLVIRVAGVLTYLRLHTPQETIALMYGTTQSDISRDLRRLLPLIRQVLPSPEVWQEIAEAEQLTSADILQLEQLSDRRAIVDATEQEVYRASDNDVRKQYYSGKKKRSR